MRTARGAPELEARHFAEHKECLPHGAGSALHEHGLAALHARLAVQQLVRRHPAQDQRRRFCRIDVRGYANEIAGLQRTIGGIRANDGQIGDALANLKAAHTLAKLIDFANDIVAEHEWRATKHRLRVNMAPDHNFGVLDAGGEHSNPYLATTDSRHERVGDLNLVGAAVALQSNDAVAQLRHRPVL